MFQPLMPFQRAVYMQIEQLTNGFALRFYNEQHELLSAEQLASIVFYQYEANFYGLHATIENDTLYLSTAELLTVLNEQYRHPFTVFYGIDDAHAHTLAELKEAASLWLQPALWERASWIDDKLVLQGAHANILTAAITEQLEQAAISLEQLPTLIPIFQQGGWPLQAERSVDGVKVALRLSEPEEQSDVWLLETVLISTTGKQWTPAARKRTLPITLTLPEKWLPLAGELEHIQQQMLALIHTAEWSVEPPTTQFLHVTLQELQVRTFLRDDLAKLQAFGFDIILPAWLKELRQSKMKVRVSASNGAVKSAAALDDVLQFKWQFSMNGEEISAEQFCRLVEEQREFVRVGTEWFQIDAAWLEQIRELMAQAEHEQWTVRDLLFQELPISALAMEDEEEAAEDPLFAFNMQRSLQHYIEQLQNKNGLPALPPPTALQAELRPYQQQGFEWLAFMREQQFGACLADDMGLGKTVQTISYLLYTYETLSQTAPTLIICPTSVLGNWQKELARFAPSLRIMTHYSGNRAKEAQFVELVEQQQPHVILSTYGTVSQDAQFLQYMTFATIVLDEAQNIKNMHTLQSRAIRKLNGLHHIALTGTPVENRLSELWAIFDFIHQGYLGSFKTFQEQFILPIERDDSDRHKETLRLKIRPFLLRRTKRDPDLQLNLPEKQESNEFCPLTVEQAALYEGYIQDTVAALEQLTGFEKKGRILKMLNKLKQLCNHPALYLKEPFDDAATMLRRSNKLTRIMQMTAEIIDSGEQCLIFTQYIGMGQLLQHCFAELYELDVPFLTGSMTKQQRDRLVEAFQAGEFPIFILSLKAGGTGLNLTAANHVFHVDRWWNPAVENQATDRAYRIGQTQFVQVHKFVTVGTIEEKIDKMIAVKSALSEELIQSSQWITELDDAQLFDLLRLDT